MLITPCPAKHKNLFLPLEAQKTLCSRVLLSNYRHMQIKIYLPFFLLPLPFPTISPGLCRLNLLLEYS